jgi:hypothetical protein
VFLHDDAKHELVEDAKQELEDAKQGHGDAKQKQDETEPKHEEMNQNERYNWFKAAFLNSKHKVKKDIHEKLRR